MRAIFAADLHGGVPRYNEPVAGPLGSTRMEEFERVLGTLGNEAISNGCDYVLIGGDTFDHRHPTPTMLRVLTQFCARMNKAGVIVLMVPGNHDSASTIGGELTHTLYWLSALQLAGIRVYTRPTIDYFEDMTLVAFPYPHRRAIGGGMADPRTPEERVIEAGVQMEALIHQYAQEAVDAIGEEAHRPLVFLGHMTVLGSRTASERLMRMEWDVAVTPETFEGFDFVALGHIHKMQGVGPASPDFLHAAEHTPQPRIWYPGSPVYLDFSEARQPKGFLLVEVEPDGSGTIIPVASHPREMARVRLAYDPYLANVPLSDLGQLRDKIVELTITGPRPPEAWVAKQEAAIRAMGVSLTTKITPDEDIRVPTQEEETPDLTDKVSATARYLRERGLPEEPYLTAARAMIEGRPSGIEEDSLGR